MTTPQRQNAPPTLRDWLEASEFEGSVQRFAQALGVPLKTAEDWVYGRSMPSARNRRKVAKPEGAG